MAFANFFISEGEITKQYKGCFRNGGKGPLPGDRGTFSGEWVSPSPLTNILPLPHKTEKNLYIFPIQQGGYVKMVGMRYGGPEGPVRDDGRAYSPVVPLNVDSVSEAWDESQYKNVGSDKYNLSVTNETAKINVNQCMTQANKDNVSIFSVSNLSANNMAQCLTGPLVSDNKELMIRKPENIWEWFFDGHDVTGSIDESECLKRPNANTVYEIDYEGPNSSIMGNTYMGKKRSGDSDKMTFYKYPDSMLSLGTEYNKVDGFDSKGGDLKSGRFTDSNPESCKQLCANFGQECKGLVFDNKNNICYLKNMIFPKSARSSNSELDIYTRMPVVENNPDSGCPKGVKAVASGFLSKHGFISKKEPMTVQFQCNDDKKIRDEELKNIAALDSAYDSLSKEVKGLETENNQILKGFDEVRKRFNEQVMAYDNTNKDIREIVENPTSEKLFEDMKELSDSFSLRNTGLLMLFILFLLISLRVFRR